MIIELIENLRELHVGMIFVSVGLALLAIALTADINENIDMSERQKKLVKVAGVVTAVFGVAIYLVPV